MAAKVTLMITTTVLYESDYVKVVQENYPNTSGGGTYSVPNEIFIVHKKDPKIAIGILVENQYKDPETNQMVAKNGFSITYHAKAKATKRRRHIQIEEA